MTSGPINSSGPFLIESQRFSKEEEPFIAQITKINADISRAVNIRDIAIYDLQEVPTGQQWFNSSNPQVKRNGFRQVFTFTAAGNIAHGITGMTLCNAFGEFTDGINFYGTIYASNVAIAGQVTFYVTPTNIVVQAGGGAPAIVNGVIVLEYLKN